VTYKEIIEKYKGKNLNDKNIFSEYINDLWSLPIEDLYKLPIMISKEKEV